MQVERPLRLLHVTDPHLFADEHAELYGVPTVQSFRAVVRRALETAAGPPDAVLATGDIADDESEQAYAHFATALGGLGVPVLCLPGNHDSPAAMSRLLSTAPFQYCGGMQLGGWRLILLDSHLPGEVEGRLAEAELVRLEAELAAARGQHALVCVHHQLLPMGSRWLDACGLVNADAARAVLERHNHVRAAVWGHVHQASDRWHGSIRMLSTPSTCAQFTPQTETCVMDMRPPGFRRLELMPDGEIRTEVAWLDDWRVTARPPDSRFMDAERRLSV